MKDYLHWLFSQNELSHLLLYKLNSFYPLNPELSFCLYTGKFLYQRVCMPIPFKVCLFQSVILLAPRARQVMAGDSKDPQVLCQREALGVTFDK